MSLDELYSKINNIITNEKLSCNKKINLLQSVCYELFIKKEIEKTKEWENGFKKALETTKEAFTEIKERQKELI